MDKSLEELRDDLLAAPMRISAHHDIPFAIFRYNPALEYKLRKQLHLLAIRLKQADREVCFYSLGRLMWQTVAENEGVNYLCETEKLRGFNAAETHIHSLMEEKSDYAPAYKTLLNKLEQLDPVRDILFLVRTGAFAPNIFRVSDLLGALQNQTRVPIIAFYPGSVESGTDLRFYGLPHRGAPSAYNYRVRIYGAES